MHNLGLIPRPLAAGPEAASYTRGRHSRGYGNLEGRDQGGIRSNWSLCLPFLIPPYQARGRLNQVRNDKFKHQIPRPLAAG